MTDRIDLSNLPAPDSVETLDFETIYQELLAEFRALYPNWTAILESDPAVKLLELAAYREMLLRARINDAARAVMLAYAVDADLDHLAALVAVRRLTDEPDERLRLRAQRALEGISTAGASGSYIFHALSADARVADVTAVSPTPADALITVLSTEGDGTAPDDLLQTVDTALNAEHIRPVADRVTVKSATIVPYTVEAVLHLYPGPEAEPIFAAAEQRLAVYCVEQRRLGRDIRRSALYAALHVEGVQRVELVSPTEDLVLDSSQASYCVGAEITVGESDE